MAKKPVLRLSPLQLSLLQTLWRLGEGTVAQVVEQLPHRAELAYTTVATMLRRLEERGLVRHREEGRTFIYRAVVRQEEVAGSMANEVVDRLFAGSLAQMVNHLLSSREVSAEELSELQKLVAEKRK